MNKVPMTVAGEARLRKELEYLKGEARPKVIADIAEAREHGDLKENAEYHAAREQQGFIEGRIQELEAALSNSRVIDIAQLNPGSKVVFGATVTLLEEVDDAEEETWQIVGDLEADVGQRRLAISAPLARALIGKEEGDVVDFQAPSGRRTYEIVEVRYES